MNKKILAVLLLILIYTTSVFAVTVEPIAQPTVSDAQATQFIKLNADMTAKFDALNKRLDGYPTQADILKDAQALYTAQAQLLDQFKSALIVMLIIIGFAFMGIAYGVFIYFKSKGRL